MTTFKQRLVVMVAGVLAVTGFWACRATRNPDRTWTFEFAPDMTITALGLEDALDGCRDLLRDCLNGTFPRPCTPDERADILKAIRSILRAKDSQILPW
jgi:hypothetical protein